MIDSQKLSNIKACVVAIGLVERKERSIIPRAIVGSGFFVNKEGFVLTAAHVFRACVPIFHEFDKKRTKTNIAAFHVRPNRNGFDFNVLPLPFIKLFQPENDITMAESFDIGIGIPKDYSKTVPFLEIKRFNPSVLFKDIMTCGYPSGNLSLGENQSLRLSPTIQFGRVTGLMPIDSFPVPWGVQTDIVG
ncbi:MAG TPA: trypsin-like peptidase domain-containing protein, partial [Nitrososphaeraceae archaeon]|nr:trypsin-like peptidase domain-containing protein [Nitrososphaeraceae archaeon]